MSAALAGMLRNQFPALMAGHMLIWLGIAGFGYLTGGAVVVALCVAAAGMLVTMLAFGLLALSVENNRLLARIADGVGGFAEAAPFEGAARQAGFAQQPTVQQPVLSQPVAATQPVAARLAAATALLADQRSGTAAANAHGLGRAEPVVTLRRSTAMPGL